MYTEAQSEAGSVTPTKSDISRELDMLNEEISRNRELTESFITMVDPVLRSEEPSQPIDATMRDRNDISELGQRICDARIQVARTTLVIIEASKRVAL